MDWTADANALVNATLWHPEAAECGDFGLFRNSIHWIENPAKVRKYTGTRRVGRKGKKVPPRGTCAVCKREVVLIDNLRNPDSDWPLYVSKLVVSEWP